jgi:molybdopterin converting factor small subunit
MKVRVKLFAAARQLAEADSIDVDVMDPPTVERLRQAMAVQFPRLTGLLRNSLFAVNTEYASPQLRLAPADEVACIPPVSGG